VLVVLRLRADAVAEVDFRVADLVAARFLVDEVFVLPVSFEEAVSAADFLAVDFFVVDALFVALRVPARVLLAALVVLFERVLFGFDVRAVVFSVLSVLSLFSAMSFLLDRACAWSGGVRTSLEKGEARAEPDRYIGSNIHRARLQSASSLLENQV